MRLYKGRFYACGCGLDTSLSDCSVRRVHKINRYTMVCMRVEFYVLYIRLTLINLNLLNLSKLSIHIVVFLKQIALNILLSRSYATVVIRTGNLKPGVTQYMF